MSGYVVCEIMRQFVIFKSSNGKTSSHIETFKNYRQLEIQFPSPTHSIKKETATLSFHF